MSKDLDSLQASRDRRAEVMAKYGFIPTSIIAAEKSKHQAIDPHAEKRNYASVSNVKEGAVARSIFDVSGQSCRGKDGALSGFPQNIGRYLIKMYSEEGDTILDPFAGGSVRGIVAAKCGREYIGNDLSSRQVEENRKQSEQICADGIMPAWTVGDSRNIKALTSNVQVDAIFSCPPYANLEKYSDLEDDISNMPYDNFLSIYESIINKGCKLLKPGCYACFVVSEVRGRDGCFLGLIPDTIRAFEKAGMKYYNEAILLNPVASASMRADKQFSSNKKLVSIHQNILIFRKP